MNLDVLKCTQDLLSLSMVRHTDIKMIVMKEEVYTHRSLEAGDTPLCACCMQDHTRKHQGKTPYCGFCGKKQVKQGKQIWDWLA